MALETEVRALCILGKCSTNWTTSPTPHGGILHTVGPESMPTLYGSHRASRGAQVFRGRLLSLKHVAAGVLGSAPHLAAQELGLLLLFPGRFAVTGKI